MVVTVNVEESEVTGLTTSDLSDVTYETASRTATFDVTQTAAKFTATVNATKEPEATVKFSFDDGVKEEVIHIKAANMPTPTVTFKEATSADNIYTPGIETPAITGALAMEQINGASSATLTIGAKGGTKLAGLPVWLKADATENTASDSREYVLTLDPTAAGYPTVFPHTGTCKVQNYSNVLKEVSMKRFSWRFLSL